MTTPIIKKLEDTYNIKRQALEQQFLRGLIPSSFLSNSPLIARELPDASNPERSQEVIKMYSTYLDTVAQQLTMTEVMQDPSTTRKI